MAIEISAVVLILVPATTSIGFAVATVLLLAFTGAIVLALRRGERAPCRCFGSAAQPLGRAQVVRNGVLLTVAVLGLIGGQLPVATPGPAGVLVSVVAGALAATLAVTADDIVALFRPV